MTFNIYKLSHNEWSFGIETEELWKELEISIGLIKWVLIIQWDKKVIQTKDEEVNKNE